jgi:hypothetical protein
MADRRKSRQLSSFSYLLSSFSLHQERSHVCQQQTRIERIGAVDVPDVAFRVDQENAQRVIKRTSRVEGVLFLVNGLAIGLEDRLQFGLRTRG